jgi:hypothetical protein
LPRPDTIRFSSKKETDYGSLVIRFNNTQNTKNAILQFVQGEDIYRSVPITGRQWTDRMFPPGEYELRILFDENNNGKWDPGNYHERLQPEKAISIGTKLNIKANWDNERDSNILAIDQARQHYTLILQNDLLFLFIGKCGK